MNKLWNKETHQKRYITLYNYIRDNKIFKDIIHHKDDYINRYKHYILKKIRNNTQWSDGYKQNFYFMIARWLEINKQNEIEYIKIYKEEGFKLKKESDNIEGNNEMTTIKEIESHKDYNYFIEILKQRKEKINKTENYKILLLSLLIYQPPLRISFYNTCKIINTMEENDGINNYIHINRKQVSSYIVNKDKASNYKNFYSSKEKNIIEIENDELLKLLESSIKQYPRKYLFELEEKAVSTITLSRWLKDITNIIGISFDTMRSIYITNYYNTHITCNERDSLADKMRHSTQVALKNYYKVKKKIDINEHEHIHRLKNNIIKLEIENFELKKMNTTVIMKQIDNDEQHKIKKRRDIIYILNKKEKKPKQYTIDKYNIQFNDITQKYY